MKLNLHESKKKYLVNLIFFSKRKNETKDTSFSNGLVGCCFPSEMLKLAWRNQPVVGWSGLVFSPAVADPSHAAPRTYRCAAYGRNVANKFSHLFCPERNEAPFATQCLFPRSLHIWALEFEICTLSHHRQTEIQTRLCLTLISLVKRAHVKITVSFSNPRHDIHVYRLFVCDPRVVATCNASIDGVKSDDDTVQYDDLGDENNRLILFLFCSVTHNTCRFSRYNVAWGKRNTSDQIIANFLCHVSFLEAYKLYKIIYFFL